MTMSMLTDAPNSDPMLAAAQAGSYDLGPDFPRSAPPRSRATVRDDQSPPAPALPPSAASAVAPAADAPPSARRTSRFLSSPTFLLGVVGLAGGTVAMGALAYRVAHPLPTVALLAALGGVAGGAAGAAVPSLLRAIKWGAIALAILAIGAGALWAIYQVDPLLRLQLFPRG